MMNIGRLRQFGAAFASGYGSLIMSLLSVWPSYTLQLYMSDDTPLSRPITRLEESLIGSLPALGAMAGTIGAGPILNVFGRRNGGVMMYLPFVVSWAIISASSSVNVILAARFLGGIGGGATLVLSPIMVSEVSEDSIRGFLASVAVIQFCIGNLMSYMLGWCLSYRMVIWTNLVIALTGIIFMWLVDETPIYFLTKGRDHDARIAIARYRGVPVSSMIVTDEIYRLKKTITPEVELKPIMDATTKAEEAEKEILNLEENISQANESMSSFRALFNSPSSRRAFGVTILIMTLQLFMGMVPVQVYANFVFAEADPTRVDLYAVVLAICQCFGAVVTAVAADKTGRRFLQISSSALLVLCLIGMGVLLQFRIAPPWVTVILIMLFTLLFTLGVGTVPYVLLAEVFVPEVANLATIIIVEWVWLANFIIIGIFPYITDWIGIYGAFYCFAIAGVANSIVSYIILPETAGLSNEQIQEAFLPKKVLR